MPNDGNLPQPLQWAREHLKLVVSAFVVVAAIIVVISTIFWVNSINNDGFTKQRDVVTVWNQYQTTLSTCLDTTRTSANIATEEYRQVRSILTAVVRARYERDGALTGDAFVSALAEQYPQIDRSLWKQLMTVAVGCRQQAAGANEHLQWLAGRFDEWTETGNPLEKLIRPNYPNRKLKAVTLNGTLYGREALEFIVTPITTAEAQRAVQTHEMPTQELFDNR